MPFPASLDAAITEATELKAAVETVVSDAVNAAAELNVTEVRRQQVGPDDNTVRMTITLQSSGLTDSIADKFETFFKISRGTR